MMLRLVLVGIVAGLGVTIPSRPAGQGWFGSAGRWANSVLAELDTWKPDERGSVRVAPKEHECEQCRLARVALASRQRTIGATEASRSTKWTPAPAVGRAEKPAITLPAAMVSKNTIQRKVVFEPIAVSEDFYAGVAFELNKNAEGLDLPQPPALPTAVVVETSPVRTTESLELELPEVLCGATDDDLAEIRSMFDEDAAPANTESSRVAQAIESPVVSPVIGAAVSLVCVEPARPVVTTQPLTQVKAQADSLPWPAFAPTEPVAKSPTKVVHETTVPWPVFAPVEARDDALASETALPRNATPAVTASQSAPIPMHAGSSSEAGLGQAVRLTRQALGAWMSVLVRSEPVQVTAR